MNRGVPQLHTHSHYSLLTALPKIDELVSAAKNKGVPALALTDSGNLYGAIEFYKACHKENIKPIIGVDIFVATRTRRDKQAGVDNRRSRIVLLAKNEIGYKNLIKLVTAAHLEGFYYKPRVDRELLARHHDGLIAIAPTLGGEISHAVSMKDNEHALESACWHRDTFGAKNFFIEITKHPEREGHDALVRAFVKIGKETKIPLMAGQEILYINPEDKRARDTLLLVNSNGDTSDKDDDGTDFSFKGNDEMAEAFRDLPEALENAVQIAENCNLSLTLGKWVFPKYALPGGRSADQELEALADKGLPLRHMAKTPDVESRLKYELDVIKKKGYAPYFLVVSDLLRHAREKGILSTTRGSAGGSLVSYLTYITTVNPLEYKLPFERFLNPERPSAPDIDMDIADNRRDEMIEYAKEKYGADRVAQIGTFGTMMARGAVRDVARALGYEYAVGDRIAKLIPMGSQGFPMSINHAMEIVPELAKMYKSETDTKEIIDMARKIEGCARHISVHAAGVVIAPTALTDFVPLQFDPKGGKLITQYDMYAVEDAGLLKFDFLGIKNLSILADAVALAKKIEGKTIDVENIPLDDKKTFEMLSLGETGGLFQLNGSGMTRYLKDLRPTTINDINAMVALYRPGPMESIPEYVKRKNNPALVRYLDPRMKDILSESYGVITYQDDVLLIAINLGGYSWPEADKLRKAMGKKIPAEMEAQREKLVAGAIKNGMSEEKAQALWRLIEPFAAYGFNKAHAASYGKVAYQTAYMKANFPAIYMSAVLTADSGDVEKVGEIIGECARMGIPVLPPSVNESYGGFTVVKTEKSEIRNTKYETNSKSDQSTSEQNSKREARDEIRFGLTTIKNFGEGIATAIIEERKRGGRFKSLADFLERVRDRNLNKKSLEALIMSGAMDEFGERGEMLANLEELLSYNKESTGAPESQNSLFGLMANTDNLPKLRLRDAAPASAAEKLLWEKELLGLYISGHPLDKFRNVLEKREQTIKKIKEEFQEGMIVVVGGIIEEAKSIITKKSEQMMFLRLSDLSGGIEVVVFPRVFTEFKKLLAQENCVAIKGRVSTRNGDVSIIAEKVKELS